ncbi:MAG: hypothetical protein RL263_657 [Bacteroidota bacterium]|jgi:hypothetical protein
MKNKNLKSVATEEKKNTPADLIFNKENYVLIAISTAMVILGFVLMSGKTGDIYDFRRATLAPIIVILGFGVGIAAIFYRKK